jgi:hypothetical protein
MGEPLQPPPPLDAAAAEQIRNFLLKLADDRDVLVEYVRDPVAMLARESSLSPEAKALLLDGNFARVHAVMKQQHQACKEAGEPAPQSARWLMIWLV